MTRIVLITRSFPNLSETFIVAKFLELQKRGFDIYISFDIYNRDQLQYFPQLKTPASRSRFLRPWPGSKNWHALFFFPLCVLTGLLLRPLKSLSYIFSLEGQSLTRLCRNFYLDSHLIKVSPDIIHFEFGTLAKNKMHLAGGLGCRIVASFRGFDLNLSGTQDPDFYKEVWEKAAAFHFLGEDLWKKALQRGCRPDAVKEFIPPAVDITRFQPGQRTFGNQDDKINLLSVGRLDWRKGYEYALHAIRLLLDRGFNCQYQVIGSGEYLEAVAFAIHQFDLEDHVILAGPKSPDAVRQCMQDADIFIHAAVSEGFCNAVIEAQAMALPVVCTDAGGLPENIQHGVSGFSVPRRNAIALAEAVEKLIMDPVLRAAMGMAGRERVKTNFTLDRQASLFEALYRKASLC